MGTWRRELDGNRDAFTWDARCKELFGLPSTASVNAQVWFDSILPADRGIVEASAARALDPADPDDHYVCDYRVRRPDGVVAWLSSTGRAYFKTDPEAPGGRRPVRILGTIRDIAEAKATRAALAESEARFREIFDNAAVGVAEVALDGRWIRVNRKLCAMLGYEEAELLAKTFQDITHVEDLAPDLDQIGRLIAGEISAYTLEKRYIANGGALLWINLTVSLLRDESGAPRHFISVARVLLLELL